MLVIVSDLHLRDGTIGLPIAPQTFSMFASRLRELAYEASWRADGSYRPMESIDILLLGDILDPLQSSRWFDEASSVVRPWYDPNSMAYGRKLAEITHAILAQNQHASSVFRRLAQGDAIRLPPATAQGQPAFDSREQVLTKVRIHYVVGNHDWFYHLRGQAYDQVRSDIIQAFGLHPSRGPFPHDPTESGLLTGLLLEYGLVARHGDIFDKFSYNPKTGRDAASLSDIYSSEVVFRFPIEIEQQMGQDLPAPLRQRIKQMTSVHPLLVIPFWLRKEIERHEASEAIKQKTKAIWDDLVEAFLDLDAVREAAGASGLQREALRLLMRISKNTSFDTLADVTAWLRKNLWGGDVSIVRFARKERDITDKRAQFVVYGHTHTHEVVALDGARSPEEARQAYINTGTWGTFYSVGTPRTGQLTSLATCVTLYHNQERKGRKFETWQANFS